MEIRERIPKIPTIKEVQDRLARFVQSKISSGELVPVLPVNGPELTGGEAVRSYDLNISSREFGAAPPAVYKVPKKEIFVITGNDLDLTIGASSQSDKPDMLVVVQGSGSVSVLNRKKVILSSNFDTLWAKEKATVGILGTVGRISAHDEETDVTVRGVVDSIDVNRKAGVVLTGKVGRAWVYQQGGRIDVMGEVADPHVYNSDLGVINITSLSEEDW